MNKILYILSILILVVLFPVYVLFLLGPENIFGVLGGAGVFLIIIPILAAASKSENYRKYLFTLNIFCIGFVTLSHLAYYINKYPLSFPHLFNITIITLPFIIILPSIFGLHELILLKEPIEQKDEKLLLNMKFFSVYIFSLLLFTSVIFFPEEGNQLEMIYIILSSFILATIVILFYWRRLDDVEIEYFLRPIKRINKPHARRNVFLFLSIFIVISLISEIHRGLWFFWIESLIFIILLFLSLWKFYRHIFLPAPTHIIKPEKFSTPNIWNLRFIVINSVMFIIFVILTAIVKVWLK